MLKIAQWIGRAQWAAALLLGTSIVHAAETITALSPEDIRWIQRRSNPDVYYAGIYSEPAKSGPYAFRVRAQAGHSLPPHTHPDERTITVLRGTYWAGVGEVLERDRLVAYPAGSFYIIPAGLPHYSAVLEGEVEFQEAGVGPSRHDLVAAQLK